MPSKIDIEAYINRIKYQDELRPNLEVLKKLQKQHLLHVPFENLDIHYHNKIHLDLNAFYKKVVQGKRGGFCYELNGLFNQLLLALGFQSKIISARVYSKKLDDFGQEFDHLAIIVNLNQVEYLVDVGFGEFSFHPLKFELQTAQKDPRGNFIVESYKKNYYVVSKIIDGNKKPEYIFSEKERDLSEFTEMCHHHQTSPNSHFTKQKLISRPTENGRITLTNNTLKITEDNKKPVEKYFKDEEFLNYLSKYFDVEYPTK